MTTREDWSAAAAAFVAQRRAELAPEVPEPETLEAFYRGELSDAEADEVRDFLACHPEIARAFIDDEMPEVAADSPLASTVAERAAGWSELAKRLGLPSGAGRAPLEFVIPSDAALNRRNGLAIAAKRRNWLAIAASLAALVFGVFFVLKTRELTRLEAEIAKAQFESDEVLRPAEVSRGPERPTAREIAPERGGTTLRIDLPEDPEDRSRFRYRVELYAERGQRMLQAWPSDAPPPRAEGLIEAQPLLEPQAGNVLRLRIARGSFPLGVYELRVLGISPSGETFPTSYWIQIVDPTSD